LSYNILTSQFDGIVAYLSHVNVGVGGRNENTLSICDK